MHPIARSTVLVALAGLASAASAQSETAATAPAMEATAIELAVEGDVRVSTGGEFVPATPGQPLQPGHRVLVGEGAAAELAYGNGCGKRMSSPGVYTVSADCQAAPARAGMSQGAVIAAVAGGVAVIAAASGGGGDDPPPPVSR